MYDVVIIGGGISGLTASIYASRGGAKTLVIDSNVGGAIINSNNVQNYPGFKSISGLELINNIKEQAVSNNVEFLNDVVLSISDNKVITETAEIDAKVIIIATGTRNKKLNCAGEDDFIGRGVSYCATCDGAFFRNKDVAVIGGGNTALEDAIYLSNICNKVYLIHRRDEFRAEASNVDKAKVINNIEFVLNDTISSINGECVVQSITLSSGSKLNVSGVFIAIGSNPVTDIVSNILDIDTDGYIISNDTLTNKDNIFVCGDVMKSSLKQLVTAASSGAIAATNALKYLNK